MKEQILYDFKLFIREGFFYNYSDSLLCDFAYFMDDLFCPTTRDYYNVFISIMENREILFSNSNIKLSKEHLKDIKLFIDNYFKKYHLKKLSDEQRRYYDIALYDFRIGIKIMGLKYICDLYCFAQYMKRFYKKIPYNEVAYLLVLLKNNQGNLLDVDFYLNFLNSECTDLENYTAKHFMEAFNYDKSKVLFKEQKKYHQQIDN